MHGQVTEVNNSPCSSRSHLCATCVGLGSSSPEINDAQRICNDADLFVNYSSLIYDQSTMIKPCFKGKVDGIIHIRVHNISYYNRVVGGVWGNSHPPGLWHVI